MSNAKRKGTIRAIIHNCTRCPLRDSALHPVPGHLRHAEFAIIGEAPGAEEDIANKPFVGPSGRLIRQLFSRHRIDLADYAILNTVCCRPPSNRAPYTGEIHACSTNLKLQLSYVRPRFVLLLGATALSAFHAKLGVTKHHGIPFHLPKDPRGIRYGDEPMGVERGPIFVPTFHPAAALRYKPNQRIIERDLEFFMALTKAKNPYALWPNRCIRCETIGANIDPIDYLEYCDDHTPTHKPYDAPLIPTTPPKQETIF